MNLFLFVASLMVVVGLMGFGAWIFIHAFKLLFEATTFILNKVFVYPVVFMGKAFAFITKKLLRGLVLFVRSIRKSLKHIARKIALFVRSAQNSFKNVRIPRKETVTRPEEVVIQSEKEKEEEPLPSAFSSHLDSIDWSVYDTPTFVRKGILLW